MQAAKTFERNGVRYRPGDALPSDLDATTKAHYLRHGMIREGGAPAPTQTKPAAPARRPRPPGPKQAETPGPTQTTGTQDGGLPEQTDPPQGAAADGQTGQQPAAGGDNPGPDEA